MSAEDSPSSRNVTASRAPAIAAMKPRSTPSTQATACSAARRARSRSPVRVAMFAAVMRTALVTKSLAVSSALSIASSCSAVAAGRSPRIIMLSACAPSISGVNWP